MTKRTLSIVMAGMLIATACGHTKSCREEATETLNEQTRTSVLLKTEEYWSGDSTCAFYIETEAEGPCYFIFSNKTKYKDKKDRYAVFSTSGVLGDSMEPMAEIPENAEDLEKWKVKNLDNAITSILDSKDMFFN